MSESLDIKTTILDNKIVVKLRGSINEDSDFTQLLELNDMKTYEFDFDEITLINSCGVREWTNFINKLGGDCALKYFNCKQIIIEQINMVHGFIPENASIESFYAPYFCEKLDKEYKILLKTSDIIDKKAPVVKCPDGEYEMEFDAIETQYFNFIK